MKEKIISSEYIFRGKIINLRRDLVLLQSKNTSSREIVEHSGSVCALVVNDNDQIYFVKQYRSPHQEEIYELPAGKIDNNEAPMTAIKRELIEEVGVDALNIEYAGKIYPSPGYTNEQIFLYFVDKFKITNRIIQKDEELNFELISIENAYDMINQGILVDGKSILLLLKYKEKLLYRHKYL